MSEIQLQDIVRQSLQHVGISLTEALETSATDPAFAATVVELTESLVQEVIAKLEASALSFEADIGAVRAIVEASEVKRREYTEARAAALSGAVAADIGKGSSRYLEKRRSAKSMASQSIRFVGGLDGRFKDLSALLPRYQCIVIASRIEIAKTRALNGAGDDRQGYDITD